MERSRIEYCRSSFQSCLALRSCSSNFKLARASSMQPGWASWYCRRWASRSWRSSGLEQPTTPAPSPAWDTTTAPSFHLPGSALREAAGTRSATGSSSGDRGLHPLLLDPVPPSASPPSYHGAPILARSMAARSSCSGGPPRHPRLGRCLHGCVRPNLRRARRPRGGSWGGHGRVKRSGGR